MRYAYVAVLAALMVLPPGTIAAEGDKATEAFDAVYGADLKRVKATPDAKDDLDLASRLLAAAAKGIESTPEPASKELGQWYRTLAEGAPPAAKAAMYARSKAYHEKFLELHTAEDLDRTTVALVLKKISAELTTLTRPGEWWGGLPRRQCLGVGTWCSNVVFHTARLKMLSGKAKLLGATRPPAGAAAPREPQASLRAP
jgi:hypothetical protein